MLNTQITRWSFYRVKLVFECDFETSWSLGPWEPWTLGPLDLWTTGPWDPWTLGLLDLGTLGPLGPIEVTGWVGGGALERNLGYDCWQLKSHG